MVLMAEMPCTNGPISFMKFLGIVILLPLTVTLAFPPCNNLTIPPPDKFRLINKNLIYNNF
jgi:hypothetical protein